MKNTFENPNIEIINTENNDILLCSGGICADASPSDGEDIFNF